MIFGDLYEPIEEPILKREKDSTVMKVEYARKMAQTAFEIHIVVVPEKGTHKKYAKV